MSNFNDMSDLPAISESTPGCSSSSPHPVDHPPETPTTTEPKDEDWGWEADRVSEWESDWDSGGEKDLCAANKAVEFEDSETKAKKLTSVDVDDSEPRVTKLKSMKILTGHNCSGEQAQSEEHRSRPRDNVHKLGKDSDLEEGAGPETGYACHYCRQRSLKKKVHCHRCPRRYCGPCLQNRNGEQIEVETQEGMTWVCPKCRGGCGPGCHNCCTCGPCRKRQGLPPTGQLIRLARLIGFDNVHDYLIHLQTKECPEEIASRKEGRRWTKSGGATSSTHGTIINFKPAQLPTRSDKSPTGGAVGKPCHHQQKGRPRRACAKAKGSTSGDITRAVGNHVNKAKGEPGSSIQDIWKPLEPFKFNTDEHQTAVIEQKRVFDHILGREAQRARRIGFSLDQILNRLLNSEDQGGKDKFGQLIGNTLQTRRNRKHRKMGRILEPFMFKNRTSRHIADIITKVADGFPPAVGSTENDSAKATKRSSGSLLTFSLDNMQLNRSFKAPTLPAKQSASQDTMPNLQLAQFSQAPTMREKQSILQPTVHYSQLCQSSKASIAQGKRSDSQMILKNMQVGKSPKAQIMQRKQPVRQATVQNMKVGQSLRSPIVLGKQSVSRLTLKYSKRGKSPKSPIMQAKQSVPQPKVQNLHLSKSPKSPVAQGKQSISHPTVQNSQPGKSPDSPILQGKQSASQLTVQNLQFARTGIMQRIQSSSHTTLKHLQLDQSLQPPVTRLKLSSAQRTLQNVHVDPSPDVSTTPLKQSPSQPQVQDVHYHYRPFSESVILRRPATSLQALRKTGVLGKHINAAVDAQEEPSPKQGRAIASPLIDRLNNSSHVAPTVPEGSPAASSDSGLEAILRRHLERRKKMEVRSCSKSQEPALATPESDKRVTQSPSCPGELRAGQAELQSGFGRFSERRSSTGFEMPGHGWQQSGFEFFSRRESSIRLGSFRKEETEPSALKT